MVKKLKWNLVLMSALYLGLGVFLLMKPTTALNIAKRAPYSFQRNCTAHKIHFLQISQTAYRGSQKQPCRHRRG